MNLLKKIVKPLLLIPTIIVSLSSQATIVQMETNLGPIQINLYDETTPATVANFLSYINSGSYSNTIIHRSISNFIIQGGGFVYNSDWPPTAVVSSASVTNEPVYSNVRATIAMAKLEDQPNSATNEWFINLGNNASNLDNQNGGFTVFGQVVDGMTIVDQISNIPTYSDIPLQAYDVANDPNETNLIIISSINIINATVNSAASLNPTLTTRADPTTASSDSGGGSLGLFALGLLAITFRRNLKNLNSKK